MSFVLQQQCYQLNSPPGQSKRVFDMAIILPTDT